jgi:hypothetical protein
MSFCPNCKYEYQAGILKCADCGAELIDSLPGEIEINYDEFECIFTCDQFYEAEMMKDNLESAGIAAQILSQKDRNYPGPGDLSIIKVFVNKDDKDEALEFVRNLEHDFSNEDDENKI